jgi:hypothetical protein
VHVDALGLGEQSGQQTDCSGSHDEEPFVGPEGCTEYGTQRVPAGFHERTERVIDVVGQIVQGACGHAQLLTQRTREVPPHADFGALLTDVLVARATAPTDTTPEHRVTHDPSSQPTFVDTLAERGDRAHPLVSEAQRKVSVTVVEIGHLTREELNVGAAKSDALHVDDHEPTRRRRSGNLHHLAGVGLRQLNGAHQCRRAPAAIARSEAGRALMMFLIVVSDLEKRN